jgi:hypothetical protein
VRDGECKCVLLSTVLHRICAECTSGFSQLLCIWSIKSAGGSLRRPPDDLPRIASPFLRFPKRSATVACGRLHDLDASGADAKAQQACRSRTHACCHCAMCFPGALRVKRAAGDWPGAAKSRPLRPLHSFAMTRTKIVLILHPYDLQPTSLLWSTRPISEHYRWSPENGTRIVVMDRGSGECAEHRGPPFFFFHTVNAFDLDHGAIRLELLAYTDASVIRKAMLMSEIRPEGLPSLTPNANAVARLACRRPRDTALD